MNTVSSEFGFSGVALQSFSESRCLALAVCQNHCKVFHLALMETLTAYALCDAREHGRLLEMRDTYLSCLKGARDVKVPQLQCHLIVSKIVGNGKRQAKRQQSCFCGTVVEFRGMHWTSNILTVHGNGVIQKDLAAASTTAKPLEDKEWLQKALLPMRELSRKEKLHLLCNEHCCRELQEARVKHMSYPEWEAALKDGAQPAQQLLTTYRDGLMRKKKIVEPDTLAEKIFREAVEARPVHCLLHGHHQIVFASIHHSASVGMFNDVDRVLSLIHI
eukprot:4905773-Amphidinium_carterae.1